MYSLPWARRAVLAALLTSLAPPLLAQEASTAPPSGVEFKGMFIDWLESNPNSGVNPNQWGNTSILQVGADFDLGRIMNLQGGKVHLRESFFLLRRNARLDPGSNPPTSISGHFWAQDTGSTLGGAPFPNFIPSNHLSVLSYEQDIGPT